MKCIIAEIFWPSHSFLLRTNQKATKYGTTRSNMSTVMNEGVKMCCKIVTAKFFAEVDILVETSTSNEK